MSYFWKEFLFKPIFHFFLIFLFFFWIFVKKSENFTKGTWFFWVFLIFFDFFCQKIDFKAVFLMYFGVFLVNFFEKNEKKIDFLSFWGKKSILKLFFWCILGCFCSVFLKKMKKITFFEFLEKIPIYSGV